MVRVRIAVWATLVAMALALATGGCSDPAPAAVGGTSDVGVDAGADGLVGDTAAPDTVDDTVADAAADGTTDGQDCSVPVSDDPAVVALETGLVRGVAEGQARAFYAIPFAEPPTGDRRFEPPQQAECWEGELAETTFGARCPQLDGDGNVIGDEDCLTLNVWVPQHAPADGQPRSVMVFIHGGGNIQGSASQQLFDVAPIYNARRFAERHGVVAVTIQYRLGPHGFLNLPELPYKNLGTRDQIAALQWIQRNIAAFGGDPDNVMIFGESAGAVNTCTLLASPAAAGLFHRALMQSGGCGAPDSTAAEAAMDQRVEGTPCGSGTVNDRLACLRNLDDQALVELLPGAITALSGGVQAPDLAKAYGPVVDGEILLQSPLDAIVAGAHNKVPFVVGANNEELALSLAAQVPDAAAFQQHMDTVFAFLPTDLKTLLNEAYDPSAYPTPRAALVAVYSDMRFVCPARSIARAMDAAQSEPVWRYHFSRRLITKQGPVPANHGIELAYVFGTFQDLPLFQADSGDVLVSDAMIDYWASFAISGDPNSTERPSWPAYDTANDRTMVLDDPLAPVDGIHTPQCDAWDAIYAALGQ